MKKKSRKVRRKEKLLKQRRRRIPEKPKPGVRLLKDPFREVPHEVLQEVIGRMGETHAAKYEETLPKLRDLMESVDPLHLLSILAAYGLFVGMSKTGKLSKQSESSIGQGDIEFAQAVALMIPIKELSAEPATPEKVQAIWDALVDLRESFSQRRLADVRRVEGREDKASLFLQEHIRINTQSVRNWGHFRQVVRTANQLYSPLDSIFKGEVGLRATELIAVFRHLVAQTESAMTERRQALRPVFAAKTIEDAAAAYYKGFPDMQGEASDLVELFKARGFGLKDVYSFILVHSDLRLPDMFTFSIEEVAAHVGLDMEDLRSGLQEVELSFGELGGENPEHFFLNNPIWTRPVINLGDDVFFCALPQVFFSFVFQTLDGLLGVETDARKECSKRRAEFLEVEVEKLLVNSLPGCECVRNFKWQGSEGEFETDVIVKYSSFLLIVEAKAGGISPPALRGAPDRIARHIREQVVDPAIQSQRLADRVLHERDKEESDESASLGLPFSVKDVQRILRLSVTLELFAAIQSSFSVLKETICVDVDFTASPTMTLADLEVVFDILPSCAERIHYLMRRNELEKTIRLWGDELDLLGLYLETGLNLGEAEVNEMNLKLMHMSRVVDEYYNAVDSGIDRRKPELKKTKWWADICKELERRAPARWIEAAVMLLNFPVDEQHRAEKGFKQVKKNVRKNWLRPGAINTVVMSAPVWRSDAIVLLAFRERQKEKRYILMENIAGCVFDKQNHVHKC
jgi:hypothetical protein